MAEAAGLEWWAQPIISELVDKSISFLGSDIANMAEAVQHLETTILPRLQLVIQGAQHRGSALDKNQLVRLLVRLKDAYFDAEAILHDLESKRLKRKAKGENKKLLVRLSYKPIIKPLENFLKKISLLSPEERKLLHRLKNLKEVAEEAETFRGLWDILNTENTFGTSSLLAHKVFGRDGDREDIIKFLLDDQGGSSSRKSYSVVVVTGIGGAGKTTLAQYVYNDPRVKEHFDVRMWLHISKNFNIFKSTEEMIECASGEECPHGKRDLNDLQWELINRLGESDNIMVVLDDVWCDSETGENQWDMFLKPVAWRERTCKIVVTSRSTSFPSILQPDKLIHLSEMAPDDFTSLLRYHAIDSLGIKDPQLENQLSDIVDHIAKKLSKSPLVAKIVGNQLRNQPDITFWQATLENDNVSNTMESIQNTESRQLTKSRPLTSSLLDHEVFGCDGDREDIIKFLLDDQGGSSSRKTYSVVVVTGIEGAGKTTLAQYVYNDPRVKEHFGVRMWLHLSEKWDIMECTKHLIECASKRECPDVSNLNVLQNMLIETLCESDKVMVILDDVWYDSETGENQWDGFLKPVAWLEGTCKIVVTSRSTSFPYILQPDKHIHLGEMAPDDFMSLLRYHAIDSLGIKDPQLENQLSDIVDQIAKKLSKLPLVAKIVGNQLRNQPDITFWQATLENDNVSNTMESIQNTESRQLTKSRPPTSSLLDHEVFGCDGDREDIIKFLLDDQGGSSSRKTYSVVVVTGIEGAGKTTLAQYVYNDPRVKEHFGVRMWLHLSEKWDIIECTKHLIECASKRECPDVSNLNVLQNMLIETLCESDKVMVILDDVWYDPGENQYWDILFKPFACREGTCKIVVTSRSTSFPFILQPDKLIHLSDMVPDDFMSLLRYHAIDGLQINNPQLKNQLSDTVDRIAKQLSKSPLVAKIVGNQLRNQPDIMFWQATLENDNLSNTTESIQNTESRLLTENIFQSCSFLSDKVFGRDGDREDIIKFLLDEQGGSTSRKSYSVVVVTGMGGAGKTALAQYVYNDPRLMEHIDIKMWLHLSEKWDIIKCTKKMIECASERKCPNGSNLHFLQNMLIETLCEFNKVMVVLDDVWYDPGENQYWDILLKPFACLEGTCKIVVTSRSTLFPSILQPDKLIHLSDMAPDDFTSLLRYNAIDKSLGIKDPQLENQLSDIVDQIAKKLSKSPLVAKFVGYQLRYQPDITLLQATIENDNMSYIMESSLRTFQRFDVKLQRCFLFCSVFPKGTRYNLDSLVPYWVALDFIGPSDDNRNIKDVGLEYFEKLVANYIFHPVDKTCKWYIMHDLFYYLAKKLSAEDCCRITNNEREIPSTVQHVYLQGNNENLQENLSRICNLKNLRTLILENPFIDDISRINFKFSTNFRNLRVLDLRSWGYKTLPTYVRDCKNLRLLSFWKSSIEEFPDSLLQLNHLQFLQLPSSVKTLPTNLSNFIKLRCIKMYNRYGREVTLPPLSNLRNLTSLQALHEFHVRKEKGYELHQLGPLNEIGGSLRIVNLENVSKKDEAVEARLNEKCKLKKLELVWAQSTEIDGLGTEVIEALQPPPNLELITIDGFRGSTCPTWLHEDSFIEHIKDIRFYNCNALTNLPPNFDQCCHCSELVLQNLGALRELPTIPENLARLSIIKCPCLIFVCENQLQVNEKQKSIMERQFLRRGVEGCKDILDHELNSFKQIGLVESCTEQLKILESAALGDELKLWENVNRAWWHCQQQRMNFIFTQVNKNKLKLPSMLRVVHLGYCCVSDGTLSDCLRGMSTLEELYLEGIMTITTLPPAEVLMSLHSLRVLEIRHCWYLGSLGDLHALPHLEHCLILGYTPLAPTLQFKCCPPLPPTLQSFIVNNCCIWYKQ